MVRGRLRRNVVVAALVAAVLGGLYLFLAPHPVRGPAKRVDVAEGMRIFSGTAKKPPSEEFPQLKPVVLEDVPPGEIAAGADRADPVKPASISGRVLDKNTGAGIPGALVSLIITRLKGPAPLGDAGRQFSARTDATGRYRITDIAVFGDMLLLASAEGYCPVEADLDVIRAGEVHQDIDFSLAPGAGHIAGHVLNQSHIPIPGAQVRVVSGPTGAGQAATTDEAGAFSIALPAEGEFVLRASKEGYGTERFTDIFPGMEQLELILTQAGEIAGRVTDEKGKPELGLNVIVDVEPSQQAGDKGESLWHSTAKTDASGEYRVSELSSSYTYAVRIPFTVREELPETSAKLEGLAAFVRQDQEMERRAEEFLYSRLPDAAIAQQTGVLVRPGQVTTVNFQVKDNDTRPASVYGRVTDPTTGAPVCPVRIQAWWHESMASTTWLSSTLTDVDGSYLLNLIKVNKPEKVWISAGYDRAKPVAGVDVEPGVPKELNLSVSAPIVTPVRCVDEKGSPLAGLIVTTGSPTPITDPDGRATIYGLAPYVSHTLCAYERNPDNVRHAIPEARVGVSGPFSGKPGEEVPEVVIRCSGLFGAITGQLVMPREAEEFWNGETLHMRLDFAGTEPFHRSAHVDGSYRFTMEKLGSGTCTFLMWLATSRGETPLWWWAAFENVEIVPGQTTDLGLITLYITS